MLINCNAVSVIQDQNPKKDARIRKKTGKRLHDKVFELLLKKRDITRQKAIHVKNGKGEEMAFGKEGIIVGDIFLFLQIFMMLHCFQFLKSAF